MEHDFTEWPAERLVKRYNELGDSLEIPHNTLRLEVIKRELANVAFEIHQRIHVDETIQLEVVEDEECNETEELMT